MFIGGVLRIAVNCPQITKKDRRDKRTQELMSLLYIMSGNRQERQVGHKNTSSHKNTVLKD